MERQRVIRMKTICGINCKDCNWKKICKGCAKTDGHPFGGECVTAECYKSGGKKCYTEFKNQIIDEFNSLKIDDMPELTNLSQLIGEYVNLEYTLPGGQKTKLLDDKKIYLGYQLEKENSDRCYGLVADDHFLLVCEYGCNAAEPEIIMYKKRK